MVSKTLVNFFVIMHPVVLVAGCVKLMVIAGGSVTAQSNRVTPEQLTQLSNAELSDFAATDSKLSEILQEFNALCQPYISTRKRFWDYTAYIGITNDLSDTFNLRNPSFECLQAAGSLGRYGRKVLAVIYNDSTTADTQTVLDFLKWDIDQSINVKYLMVDVPSSLLSADYGSSLEYQLMHLLDKSVVSLEINGLDTPRDATVLANYIQRLSKLSELLISSSKPDPGYNPYEQEIAAAALGSALIMTSLKSLSLKNLQWPRLSHEAFAARIDLRLEHLQLIGSNDVVFAFANAISSMYMLKSLDLNNFINEDTSSDSAVDRLAIVNALQNKSQLEAFLIANVKFGNEEMEAFAKVFQKSKLLRHLILTGNELGDNGSVMLGTYLQYLPNLQQLNLHNNKVGDVGAAMIVDGMKLSGAKLKAIDLSSNLLTTVGAIAVLLGAPSHARLDGNSIDRDYLPRLKSFASKQNVQLIV